MKRLRLAVAVFFSKLIYLACRLTGSRASTAPGKYARRICPDLIEQLAKKVRRQIIVVCGTNGKTTTNNLINTTLVKAGYKTVCNNVGANMLNGVAASFCKSAGLFGGLRADYACLEVDEANLRLLFKEAIPSTIVVTNLFRDQLDRYGEVDSTFVLLKDAFDMAKDAKLILNADDPVTSAFGIDRDAVYYGADGKADMRGCDEMRDGARCPECGGELAYEYYLYDKIGKFSCKNCGYTNKNAEYKAKNIRVKNGLLCFDADFGGELYSAESEVSGLYNVYNMLMAAAALDNAGIERSVIMKVLCSQKPEPGRMSKFDIKGKTLYLMLSKNPTGFNQSVTAVINDERKKDVLLALNATPADGEDVSWLWDVDFETMLEGNAESYTLTGGRRYDMYLRLKYGGYDEQAMTLCDDIDSAIENLLSKSGDVCYLLVNYSAMYPAYRALKSLEKGSDGR